MDKYYDALLKLCGFEDGEINLERPRIEKAFQRLELKPEDMGTAEKWLNENHDMKLLGVRKLMRLWLKELIDMVLAKDEGKKLLFYGFPTISGPSAAIASASDKVFCLCPDAILAFTMGHIFNKTASIIEAAEKNGLPPGHSLCSLQQTRVGGLVKGIIPVPDMVLTSSYYCDMGSKTDELLHERYGHPAVYIDGSMDSRWGEFPDYDPKRVTFLGGEVDKALDKVKEILGIEVTEEARREGAIRNKHIMQALNELVLITRDAEPQPISIIELDMIKTLSFASGSQRIISELADVIQLLNAEVKERVTRGTGIVAKGAPRVGAMFLHLSDPSIMRMVEKAGLAVPVSILDIATENYKKPVPIISGELLVKEEFKLGIFYGSCGFITRVTEALKDSKLDGFIWNYLYNCHPLTLMSHLLVQHVTKETDIPILSLESDLADSRVFSAESQRTKVETFAEMLKARKA
ncbi:MAG: 2-hydroxyacyl-CoA dehydratase family protein [Dehalococcoidales bacterium]|nr:2-hydroxyacyl-CoA dehydratase family protein [Dehalococcoidales bacterium]